MTLGVRLSSMRVDAFRGISDPIEFDLTSPITLVFAPNGTGKTTLCEAAEWLLTGQVERLRDKKDFDPTVLRSKFVTDQRDPTVEANIIVGDQSRSLVRAAHGAQQEARIGETFGEEQRIGPNDLLSFLAPAAAAQEAHHLTAISLRQRWLKGTRFLSAEALAALVDSDDDTIERRTQVFADLLGIRHLLDAEKVCDRFITDLTSHERSLSQTISGQESDIADLTTALKVQAERGGATTSAVAEVEAGERGLKIESDLFAMPPTSIEDRLEGLSGEHGRRQHFLNDRTTAIEAVGAEWDARVEIERKLGELTAVEAQLAQQLSEIEEKGRAASSAVTELSTRQGAQSEQARALATAKDSLIRLIIALSGSIASASSVPIIAEQTSLGELARALPEADWTTDAQERRQTELRAAIDGLSTATDEGRRIELLKAQLEALTPRLISEEAFAVLRAEAAQLETVAVAAKSRLDAASDPLARLQAAGRDFLAHTHDVETNACPLCSHDWDTPDQLREAITISLSAVPELARLAQTAATSASDAARLAKARFDEASALSSQAANLRQDIQALEAAIALRLRELEHLGVSPSDPATSLAAAERRISVAIALAALIRERDRLASGLPGEPSPLLQDDALISDLPEQFGAAVSARDQVVQFQLSTTTKELEVLTTARDKLRADHAVIQQHLRDCRQELARLRPELERLKALWEKAAPNQTWTVDALSQAREELASEKSLLAKVAAHIAAARGAWNSEVRRTKLQELTSAVEPLRGRLTHMRARIAAASRARATFHQTYTEVSERQVDDLSRVVNPLFARMHANRVFDKINLGQTDDFLRWLADAGTQKLDPGKDFSQGQRQDLALALFLARARSLGGTFFLDEPITHLDDLNRVGLLDIFRATVMESSAAVNLVITTASKALARHLIEKFSAIGTVETPEGKARPLRVIELDGNGRTGVTMRNVYPAS